MAESDPTKQLGGLAGTDVEVERLRGLVGERALAEGMVDVTYAEVDSPFGEMLAATTERGLVYLSFPRPEMGESLARLSTEISPRLLRAPSRLDPVRRQLEEYFAGDRRDFDLDLDWRLTRGFTCEVLRQTNEIPFGATKTYKEMAEAAGSPGAHRAAGSALGANPIPIVVPCHRVLRVGGALGGYGGGLHVKRHLLKLEGVLD